VHVLDECCDLLRQRPAVGQAAVGEEGADEGGASVVARYQALEDA
jgi:hypothetical protein